MKHGITFTLILKRLSLLLPLKQNAILTNVFIQNNIRLNRERDRYPDEKRSKHYLREEFAMRLSQGTVNYKLQLQLHDISPRDRPHVLHCGRFWDESTHPWIDLADVTITTILPPYVIERTQFNIGNLPPSLGFIGPPESVHDFRCIPYIRKEIYKRSQSMRLLVVATEKPQRLAIYYFQIQRGETQHEGTKASISASLTGKCAMVAMFMIAISLTNN